MNEKGRALVVDLHEAAVQRQREDKARQRELIEKLHREAVEKNGRQPPPAGEPATLACTELPEAQPGEDLYLEWNLYRREVCRLLAEGQEGRWVLIKGEEIVGIWDTRAEAKAASLRHFLMQWCLIQQIRSREPLVRVSWRLWRS